MNGHMSLDDLKVELFKVSTYFSRLRRKTKGWVRASAVELYLLAAPSAERHKNLADYYTKWAVFSTYLRRYRWLLSTTT